MDNRSAELLPELTTRRERARRLGRVFTVVICAFSVFIIFRSEIVDHFQISRPAAEALILCMLFSIVTLAVFSGRVWRCPACEHGFRSLDIVRCDNCGLQVRQDASGAFDDEPKPRGRFCWLTKSDPALGFVWLSLMAMMLVSDCVHDALESMLQVPDWLHNVLTWIPALFVGVLVGGLSELALDWYRKR